MMAYGKEARRRGCYRLVTLALLAAIWGVGAVSFWAMWAPAGWIALILPVALVVIWAGRTF